MVNRLRGINYILVVLVFVSVTCFLGVPKNITCKWHYFEDCYVEDETTLAHDVEILGSDDNTYVLPSGLDVRYFYSSIDNSLSLKFVDRDKVYSPDSHIEIPCNPSDFTNSDEIMANIKSCDDRYEAQVIKYENYQDSIEHWYRSPRYIAPALLIALVISVVAFLINRRINNPVLMVILSVLLITVVISCGYGAVFYSLHPVTCK